MIKQELFKKLMSYAKWISSIAIHPGTHNLYFNWFYSFMCLYWQIIIHNDTILEKSIVYFLIKPWESIELKLRTTKDLYSKMILNYVKTGLKIHT